MNSIRHIKKIFPAAFMMFSLCYSLLAKGKNGPDKEEPPAYETSIFLVVQGIGGTEIPALVNGDTAYLSVSDLFDFLKIKNTLSPSGDSLTGFFIQEKDTYLIDRAKRQIHYRDQVFPLRKDVLLRSGTTLYMRLDYFSKVFGLTSKFTFRNLSVRMTTKAELPAIRELRLQLMRQNLSNLRGETKADTFIGPSNSLFRLGMMDWSVIANQRTPGATSTWVNLGFGGTIAGGDAMVSLNYNNFAQQMTEDIKGEKEIRPFDQRQQYYRWRHVNNDQPLLRQVIAGKIFTGSVSSIFAPVVGVQLTNTPSTYRRSFGSYTISNTTEPGWTVELYVNDALIDYTIADASGFYTFQVPLVYGSSQVRLRFYGPWGEERILEESISIPFNFLPKKEFEYTSSSGFVEDSLHSFFSRTHAFYGLTRHITIGSGVEYLSSLPANKSMPFATASIRMTSNLLFSGEYTHNVRTRGMISYRTPSNFQLDAQYTRYKKGQKAIIYNFREERKVMISKPVLARRFSMFTRFTFNQLISPGANYTTTELLLSGSIRRVGTSFTTYAVFAGQDKPFIYSDLGVKFRVPGQVMVMPEVQYAYTTSKLLSARCEVGKYVWRNGYLNILYEKNFRSQINNFQIGFRYDFSFGNIGLSATRGNNMTTLVESARGSVIYDTQSGYAAMSNRSMIGTGGLEIRAFLDVNGNGRHDKTEPCVQGLRVSVNGGRIIQHMNDTSIGITDMEAYSRQRIDLSRSSFENISWRISKPIISVFIEPNQIKLVEIPVIVVGEASGHVLLKNDGEPEGLGRIKVNFYRADESLVATTMTETDGFFSYIGLAPGTYTVRIDPGQLRTLGVESTPRALTITIRVSNDGEVVENLKFILEKVGDSASYFNKK
ncbi:hypothetical protein SAMN05661012_04373 [Chitinophaga sancti]|uniref:Carboxypeptidase regulatory-like domain-containing protein n=2 Tax=Chitinophaga sancti TaxID=1004 RepID=A0A1K1RWK7_9BACT|nr:hypothetical protein SAMN05661012_04373 [Chitinophaga sancti]